MKYHRIIPILLSAGTFLLAITALTPSYAEEGIALTLEPGEGETGDEIDIDGYGFSENSQLYIYFSSNKLDVGDYIVDKITAYEGVGKVNIDNRGEFVSPRSFKIPEFLDDGEESQEVLNGTYYFYAIYRGGEYIIAKTYFTVTMGKIELAPEEGIPGAEVTVTGEEMRPNQEITVRFDTSELDIIFGNTGTDENGSFQCTVIIPESTAGEHTLTTIDESGNEPQADFKVEPAITLNTSQQTIDGAVHIEGRGFAYRSDITIKLDNDPIVTNPVSPHSNQKGNFFCSIKVPYYSEYFGGEPSIVTARDEKDNAAKAELVVLDIPPAISVDPATSPASPGYVGMQLDVSGTHFLPERVVTVTYNDNSNSVTGMTDASGLFTIDLTVPPSIAGDHTITATDGKNSASSIFVMESKPPQMPVPLEPAATNYADPRARFDWQDVTDPSGVSYSLQISADRDFSTLVLEKKGLTDSEYTLSKEEELPRYSVDVDTPAETESNQDNSTEENHTSVEPRDGSIAYYWRVKAVDGAFNESDWSVPRSFYIASRSVLFSGETSYIWIAVVAAIGFLIYRMQKNKST